MSKKGVVIATAVAAVIALAGCSQQQPMPQDQSVSQSGPSGKLGSCHHCKCHHCRGHRCKGHNCKGY